MADRAARAGVIHAGVIVFDVGAKDVCNRDAQSGYSGIENFLYTKPETILLFGDAKASLDRLLDAMGRE